MTTRVYKYGLLPPTEEEDRISDQIGLAHRYYNDLIAIERRRRAITHAILLSHSSVAPLEAAVEALKAQVEQARVSIKKTRSEDRRRSDTKAQRDLVKQLRSQLKTQCQLLRDAKAELRKNVEIKGAIQQFNDGANIAAKQARGSCGIYWGTYQIVEDALFAVKRDAIEEPRFRRWRGGDGAVGVQLQKGRSIEDVIGGDDRQLQIDPVPDEAYLPETPRGQRRRLSRTMLRMRIGSAGRAPIWAHWPMVMHRPLPDGCQIKKAKVIRRRLGNKFKWEMHITISLSNSWQHEPCGEGAVAIDVGWRQRTNGITTLRVGYQFDGRAGEEILLDPSVIGDLLHVDRLRSYRDKDIEKLRPRLAQGLRDLGDSAPEWIRDRTATLYQWRSMARFAALAIAWRDQRFDGDDELFEMIESWRKYDSHLWLWEVHQRNKCLGRRKEQYRVLGATLARKYETLVLETFNLTKMQRKPAVESTEIQWEAVKRAQTIASISELRLCLINAFVSRGGRVIHVSAHNTTRICNACESVEKWDQALCLWHACSACGVLWDQDDNAAKNIWQRGCERISADKNAGITRVNDSVVLSEKQKQFRKGRKKSEPVDETTRK